MELMSLKNISKNSKILILKELSYDTDGEFIFDKNGNKVIDKYVEIYVKLDNVVILPGSEILLDDNELSISAYMEEFGDVF